MLTHPGVPCIFWEHAFQWKLLEPISELVANRKRAAVKADSTLTILAAEHDLYVASIDDRLLVKLGPRYDMGGLLPKEEDWAQAASGKDFAVWERKQA